jgi:hypothetical protein
MTMKRAAYPRHRLDPRKRQCRACHQVRVIYWDDLCRRCRREGYGPPLRRTVRRGRAPAGAHDE